MLRAVKPSTNWSVRVLAAVLTCSPLHALKAEAGSNPYQAIIERNPFGLKPPPPPQEPPPVTAVIPAVKVLLTGITSLFGRSPRALLEITEQEPGKAQTIRKPILKEGERDGGLEVVSIDIEKSIVRIRQGGSETNITFETPKLTGGPAPAAPGFPPPPLAAGMPGAPAAFSPANAGFNNSGRNGGVNTYGNTASSAMASSRGAAAGAYGGYGAGGYGAAPNYGAASGYPVSTPSAALGAVNGGTGLGSALVRPIRTDSSASPSAPAAPVDPAKQYLEMAIDHEIHSGGGAKAYPPLPPPPP